MPPFDSIICVGQTTWEGDFQKAVVQLMCELSVRRRVLYVDYQHTAKDLIMGALGRQKNVPVRSMLRLENPLTTRQGKEGSTVHVWQPPVMLPINFLPPALHDKLLRVNAGRLIAGLRRVMHEIDFKNPLIINGMHPVLGLAMLGKLNEAGTIYYCFDEITIAKWMSKHGGRFEPEYMKRVNGVITTSEALRQSKAISQPNTFCVKNGVDFPLFSQVRQLIEQKAPSPLSDPKRPVVGYLGTADDRVNIDIVEHCVRTMPDVTFQFIGEIKEPAITQRLGTFPNVLFTPPHQPANLPPLLAGLSATMIPFVCNAHTYTIYPLKINEYLAGGLPVVSTPFSILNDFAGIIELADTPDAFADALRHALTDNAPDRIQARVDMARANSWAHRADEFEAIFEKLAVA
ncbi:glycosyltransferase [Fibrella forsythiae]|uniref:Glycosyltransferase n=1 Tax=Fibrella forsythiae TaxID=2817061 RepID=A0ABS3JJS3_9BACT|nr:glycosyltransferase [Fibrella forsythiae]MBO0950257.1 glycosyltransferase [Fibrella forsythiae]